MSSTMAMLALPQPSSDGQRNLAKHASSDLDTEMDCPLTLDDRSVEASATVDLVDMSSFRSVKERQERISAARAGKESQLHSPSISEIWSQKPSTLPSISSTRSTPLPPPTSPLPIRPTTPTQGSFSTSMPAAFLNPRQRSYSVLGGEPIPLSRVAPGPVWPLPNQLKVAYTYGIRRDDGTYTQLIRADELNSYDFDRVRVSQGPEGMIILPAPEQPRPERRDGPEPMIPHDIIQSLPSDTGRPPLPQQSPNDETQMQIDSIVAQAGLSPVAHKPAKHIRREKIYCDKWIHEGVCAFTQLGCKYKHEMPMDKATQLSLGLNHGLPIWYKRAQTVQIRPEPQPADSPPSATRTAGPWRRMAGSTPTTSPSIGGGAASSSSARSSFGASSFGPIGPPASASQPSQSTTTNPYSLLADTKSEDGEEEDGSFIWAGRRR